MDGTAIVLSGGELATTNGKTTHGLLRGTTRYRLLGVVDSRHAGRDAGEVLDGRPRGVPVFATVGAALAALSERPDWCVIGVATPGGRLPPEIRQQVLEAVGHGLSLVNGLHEPCGDDPEIAAAARRTGARILDLRRPRPFAERRFWTGEVLSLRTPRIAVLGTDCAVGKRTTARMLVDACRAAGLRAEMIYTGQTGWLQGLEHGFILDATPNDFVPGELEHAVLTCARETGAEVLFLEGQSALRNPSGPCGSELILSAGARGVVLQHAPGRPTYEGAEHLGIAIPPLDDEIDLLRRYGAQTLAVTLNGEGLTPDELRRTQLALAGSLRIPVVRPLEEGVDALVPVVRRFLEEQARR